MEITCKIIQDLLPLYAEQMLSEESVQLVEEHLAGCEACAAKAKELCHAELREAETVAESKVGAEAQNLTLQKISKGIKRHRWLSVAFGVLVTATLLVGAFCWLYQPQYLAKEEAVIGVKKENGMVVVELRGSAHVVSENQTDPVTGKEIVTLTACLKRGELSFGKTAPIYRLDEEGNYIIEEPMDENGNYTIKKKEWRFPEETILWYAENNNPAKDVLLWGEETASHRTVTRWKGTGWYFLLCMPAALAFGACGFFFKEKRFGKLFLLPAAFFVSFPMALWFSAGKALLIYDNAGDMSIFFALVTVLAVLLTGSAVCGERLYRQRDSIRI